MGYPRQEVLWVRGRRDMSGERLEPEEGGWEEGDELKKGPGGRGFVGGDSQAGWHSSICPKIFFDPFLSARQGMVNTTVRDGPHYPHFTCKERVIQR